MQIVEKVCFFKKVLVLYPYKNALWALRPAKPLAFYLGILAETPNPFPVVKGCVCSVGFASLQSPWAYTPGVRAGLSVGLPPQTKQGCLQSVAHSRCTTQRHQRLTTRIGATPQTPFLNCIGLSTVCKLSCFSAFLPLCLSSLFRFLRHILKQ